MCIPDAISATPNYFDAKFFSSSMVKLAVLTVEVCMTYVRSMSQKKANIGRFEKSLSGMALYDG